MRHWTPRQRTCWSLAIALAAGLAAAVSEPVAAAQVQSSSTTWTTASDGDWSNPSNWSAGAPTPTTDAVLPAGVYTVSVTGIGSARTVTIGGNATLKLTGASSPASLTVSNSPGDPGLTNDGIVILDTRSTLNVVNGTLRNTGTGSIRSEGVPGGSRIISASVNNSGSIRIKEDTTLGRGAAAASHTNSGTIDIAAGKTLTIVGGGTFTQAGGRLTRSGTFKADNGFLSFTLAGGTIDGTGTFQILDSGGFTWTGGTFDGRREALLRNVALFFGAGGTGPVTFIIQGQNGRLLGNISYGQEVVIQGDPAGGHAALTAENGFANHGSITLDSTDARYGATLNVTQGTLTNASVGGVGGTIRTQPGAGGPRAINASIDNSDVFSTISIRQDTPSASRRRATRIAARSPSMRAKP